MTVEITRHFYAKSGVEIGTSAKMGVEGPQGFVEFETGGEEESAKLARVIDEAIPTMLLRYYSDLCRWAGALKVGDIVLTRDRVFVLQREYPLVGIRKFELERGHFRAWHRTSRNPIFDLTPGFWNFPVFFGLFRLLYSDAKAREREI